MTRSPPLRNRHSQRSPRLLTVEDVAALLKVGKSRARACTQRAALRTTPARQDCKYVPSIRDSCAHLSIARCKCAIAPAAPQWRASYGTKGQREEKRILFDDSIGTTVEVDVCSNEERGGRFAGGRWRLLPTACDGGLSDTKRWARSRANGGQTRWRNGWQSVATAVNTNVASVGKRETESGGNPSNVRRSLLNSRVPNCPHTSAGGVPQLRPGARHTR